MSNKIEQEFQQKKEPVRLNKYLSEAGVCSRREADRLIESGRVSVDGKRAETGMRILPGQVVRVGKKVVSRQDEMIVLAVNKPVGIVCTEEKRERNSIVRYLDYPVRVTLMKDEVTVCLDTSGDSLHKRGYRRATVKAPITETLAAALILLTPWKKDRILVDPFCGSGTFPIEAAMIGARIAPGMNRSFTAEHWTHLIPKNHWYDAIDEAESQILRDVSMDIQGYDISHDAIAAAMENARLAEVDHLIHFQQRPVQELSHRKKYGFIITNPPYGQRLDSESEMPALYREIGEAYNRLDSWSMYLITAFEQAERYIGKKATKNRKIYNGMMKTYFYQYMGPRPPKKRDF